MKEDKAILNISPISVNKVWQGRRFMTQEYKKWVESALLMMKKRETIKGKTELRINFYVKYSLKSDLDNYLKPAIDLIVRRGWIKDDRYIFRLVVEKFEVKNKQDERIEYQIKNFV